MKEIQKFTKAIISQKALPSVEDIKSKKLDKFTEKLNKVIDEEKHLDYIDMVNNLCNSDMTVETLAAALLSMQLNKEIKNIPVIDTGIKSKIEYEKHIKPSGNRCKLMISAGKQQRIAPNFVLGALVEATGLSGKSFGKIDIFDKHTTVEIPESEKENILMAMNNSKINGVRVSAQLIEGSSSGRNDNRNSKKNYKHHTDKHSNHKSKKSYRGRK